MTDKCTNGRDSARPCIGRHAGRDAAERQARHHADFGRDRDPDRTVGRAGPQVRQLQSAASHQLFFVAVGAALVIFLLLGLYHTIIRFMGPRAMLKVVGGVSLSVLFLAAYDRFDASAQLPLSAVAIYWALALLYVVGSRFMVRYMFSRTRNGHPPARVAIYGAGDAGARLSSVLIGGPHFEPVLFVDDKKSLQGSQINGIRVSDARDLPRLVRQHGIERILLAMPSASRRRRREILASLGTAGNSRAVAAGPVGHHRRQGEHR